MNSFAIQMNRIERIKMESPSCQPSRDNLEELSKPWSEGHVTSTDWRAYSYTFSEWMSEQCSSSCYLAHKKKLHFQVIWIKHKKNKVWFCTSDGLKRADITVKVKHRSCLCYESIASRSREVGLRDGGRRRRSASSRHKQEQKLNSVGRRRVVVNTSSNREKVDARKSAMELCIDSTSTHPPGP